MPNAKLIIRQPGVAVRKISITSDDGDISIGRAPDNTISLEGDADSSRYHAVIAARRDGFYLSDLGSTNGTMVNRRPVVGEQLLRDGDVASVGGSTTFEFQLTDERNARAAQEEAARASEPARGGSRARAAARDDAAYAALGATSAAPAPPTVAAPQVAAAAPPRSSTSPLFLTVFGVLMLGFVAGVVLLIYNLVGTTDRPPLNTSSASPTPYVFNPSSPTPDVTGNTSPTPAATPTDSPGGGGTTGGTGGGRDADEMARNLAVQLSGRSGYVFDPEFVNLIRASADRYRAVNYYPQAYANRRAINTAFNNTGTNPLIGYTLALSRSRFDGNARGEGAGLWQIPPAIAERYPGGAESAGDVERAAQVAAAYYKTLKDTFDEEDFMYAIACYGTPVDEAGRLRTALEGLSPEDRLNFWRVVRSGIVSRDKAERVIQFFAAGIVAENPRLFGLSNPRLSRLNSSQMVSAPAP